ncbi:MAG TPA: hypothetical protein DDX92_04275 [Flavobacteriales bacterium]|jgi:hypothetical protein|nr:hypothetical protein [Flavobacteriales bacterium]
MKNATLFFVLIAVFFSGCEKQEEDVPVIPEIVGSYGYVEILIDPGDGSGTFQPIQSLKTITFHVDGTVTSNGDLCLFTPESVEGSSGTYSDETRTITTLLCSPLKYQLDNDELIISYNCIEPCKAKYLRIVD